ncbi:MAG: hypothetical protein M0042_02125 [Nitrospiraceae bacterium]|nr:hypothetical protein [Nitrospiraceae bacterium]
MNEDDAIEREQELEKKISAILFGSTLFGSLPPGEKTQLLRHLATYFPEARRDDVEEGAGRQETALEKIMTVPDRRPPA